jgi:hypothetical protein
MRLTGWGVLELWGLVGRQSQSVLGPMPDRLGNALQKRAGRFDSG